MNTKMLCFQKIVEIIKASGDQSYLLEIDDNDSVPLPPRPPGAQMVLTLIHREEKGCAVHATSDAADAETSLMYCELIQRRLTMNTAQLFWDVIKGRANSGEQAGSLDSPEQKRQISKDINAMCWKHHLVLLNEQNEPCNILVVPDKLGGKYVLSNKKTKKRSHTNRKLSAIWEAIGIASAFNPTERINTPYAFGLMGSVAVRFESDLS